MPAPLQLPITRLLIVDPVAPLPLWIAGEACSVPESVKSRQPWPLPLIAVRSGNAPVTVYCARICAMAPLTTVTIVTAGLKLIVCGPVMLLPSMIAARRLQPLPVGVFVPLTSTQVAVLPTCCEPSVPVVTVNVFAVAGSAKTASNAARADAGGRHGRRRVREGVVQMDFMAIFRFAIA